MSNIESLDFSVDLLKAILWQYNDAEKLQALIELKQLWYERNQVAFWSDWVKDVFDLRTANIFGLNVWSIILDIPIIVKPEEPAGDIKFGMNETSDGNFNNSNFVPDEFRAQELGIESARLVLQLRYNQITSDGSVIHTNEFLNWIFKDYGKAYVVDNLDMTVNYVFEFPIPFSITYILQNYDILPRPAGVKIANILSIGDIPFGFGEFNDNFDQGNF